MFFRLFDNAGTPDADDEDPGEATTSFASGLSPSEVAYLEEALAAAYVDPSAAASNNGVNWRHHEAFGTAELVPPRDLMQRLEVLPQGYLSDRRVPRYPALAVIM